MGTIVGRTRKDGSKAFTAQIVIKKGGVIREKQGLTQERLAEKRIRVVLPAPGRYEDRTRHGL
jgi:hypothetical protein